MHLIVAPQLSNGWQQNHSTKTRQAGWAKEQSMQSLMSMIEINNFVIYCASEKHTSLFWRRIGADERKIYNVGNRKAAIRADLDEELDL